jgi:hypothetical protein
VSLVADENIGLGNHLQRLGAKAFTPFDTGTDEVNLLLRHGFLPFGNAGALSFEELAGQFQAKYSTSPAYPASKTLASSRGARR